MSSHSTPFWRENDEEDSSDILEEINSTHNNGIVVQGRRSFRQRIAEAIGGYDANTGHGGSPAQVIRNFNTYTYYGESPEVPFKTLSYYKDRTPQLELAVTTLAEMVYGTDININADKKNPTAEKIVKDLLDWNDQVQLYSKIQQVTYSLLTYGNAIVEKLSEQTFKDILEVSMDTIIGKKRDNTGRYIEYYIQILGGTGSSPIQLGKGLKDKDGNDNVSDRFVEFNLNMYGRKDWARSAFYSLAATRRINGKESKPLIENMWEIEDAMARIFHNFASPNMIITYANASVKYIKQKLLEFKKMKPGDAIIGDRAPDIKVIETNAQSKFDKYVEHMENTFELGTNFSNQFFTAGFSARAASKDTANIIDKKVRSIQNYICGKIMREFYIPYLTTVKHYTLDQIKKANLQVSFESENVVKFTAQDVQLRGEGKFWTPAEVRNWDKSNGVELTDDDQIQALQNTQAAQDVQQKQLAASQAKDFMQTKPADVMKPEDDPKKVAADKAVQDKQKEVYTKLSEMLDEMKSNPVLEKLKQRQAEIVENIVSKESRVNTNDIK
jgi:hypothetical protein